MTDRSPSTSESPLLSPPRRVIIVVLPGVQLLDLAGPAQVFDAAAELGAPYTLRFCAVADTVPTGQGLHLARLNALPDVSPADVILVPGVRVEPGREPDVPVPSLLAGWLRQARAARVPIASVCTGAFALGEVGLLDGRRCTTHWMAIDALRARYPTARVQDNALFVHDDGITTSAGIASGIDMALAIVEREQGARFAARVARYLVVYLRRNGAQPQQSVYLAYRDHLDPQVHQVQEYLLEHVADHVTLADLAAIAPMSTRSLTRAFKQATGITPVQYQQQLRLELAASLLHSPEFDIATVAARCGFRDARHFRRLWHRHYGGPPSSARRVGDHAA